MVTLAMRAYAVLFWLKVAVKVPFPAPDGVTVHQVWLLLAVQLVFAVTVKSVDPDVEATAWFKGLTDNVGAAWVTVTTTGDNPATVTVTFATRAEAVLFAVHVAVIVPFPDPDGVTVHQV